MRTFELYWSWYEEHAYWLLSHPTKTKKQFQADVKKLLRKYGDEYLKKEDSWASARGWIKFVAEKLVGIGYAKVLPESFGFFGGNILENDDDGMRWKKLVGEELFGKAIKHNKKVTNLVNPFV